MVPATSKKSAQDQAQLALLIHLLKLVLFATNPVDLARTMLFAAVAAKRALQKRRSLKEQYAVKQLECVMLSKCAMEAAFYAQVMNSLQMELHAIMQLQIAPARVPTAQQSQFQ